MSVIRQPSFPLAGLALAAAALAASPAQAYVVATQAQTYVAIANASGYYNYNIDFLGHFSPTGAQVGGGCSGDCSFSGSVTPDATGTLKAASSRALMTFNDGTNAASASVFARADLAGGLVGVSAGGTHLDVRGTGGQDGGSGTGNAIANDLLHFTVAGAGAGTTTTIGVTYTIEGHIDYAGQGVEASALVQPMLSFGNAQFSTLIDANGGQPPHLERTSATGWLSYTIEPATPDRIVFRGTYALSGASMDLGVQENLSAGCGGGDFCNYADTARLAFQLPANVGFTSDSGVFLTAAVPEPGSWALFAAGLGCFGFIARRAGRSQRS